MSKRQKPIKDVLPFKSLPKKLSEEDLLLFEKLKITQFPKAPVLNKESHEQLFLDRTKKICKTKVFDKETRETKMKKISTLLFNYIIYEYNRNITTLDIPDSFQFTLRVFITLNNFFDKFFFRYIRNRTQEDKLNYFLKSYFIYLINITQENRKVSGEEYVFNPSRLALINLEVILFPEERTKQELLGMTQEQILTSPNKKKHILNLLMRPDCIILHKEPYYNYEKMSLWIKNELIIKRHLLKLSKEDIKNILNEFVHLFPTEVCSYLATGYL